MEEGEREWTEAARQLNKMQKEPGRTSFERRREERKKRKERKREREARWQRVLCYGQQEQWQVASGHFLRWQPLYVNWFLCVSLPPKSVSPS